MPFIRREDLKHHVEVHVTGVCVRTGEEGQEVLIARRAEDREIYPGRWEGCGGQLRYGESFRDGVVRHFLEELGVKVVVFRCHEFYEIPMGDGVVNGIRFLCGYADGEPSSKNHSEIRWIGRLGLLSMSESDFVPGFRSAALRWTIPIEDIHRVS